MRARQCGWSVMCQRGTIAITCTAGLLAAVATGCDAKQPDLQTPDVTEMTSALSATPQVLTSAGSAISESEAKAVIAAAATVAAADKPVDLPTLLAGIQTVDGAARQKLIMEYMEQADKLPKADRDKAAKQLFGLWKK